MVSFLFLTLIFLILGVLKMALDMNALEASVAKIVERQKNGVNKEDLTTAVTEAVNQQTAALQGQVDALKTQLASEQGADAVRLADLESAITRLADALDGDDVEAAQEILEEVKSENGSTDSAPDAAA